MTEGCVAGFLQGVRNANSGQKTENRKQKNRKTEKQVLGLSFSSGLSPVPEALSRSSPSSQRAIPHISLNPSTHQSGDMQVLLATQVQLTLCQMAKDTSHQRCA